MFSNKNKIYFCLDLSENIKNSTYILLHKM